MAKLLLISIVVATIAIPAIAARDRDAVRGLRRTVLLMAAFNALYLLAVLFIWPRL